jgi:hypothetical protein
LSRAIYCGFARDLPAFQRTDPFGTVRLLRAVGERELGCARSGPGGAVGVERLERIVGDGNDRGEVTADEEVGTRVIDGISVFSTVVRGERPPRG